MKCWTAWFGVIPCLGGHVLMAVFIWGAFLYRLSFADVHKNKSVLLSGYFWVHRASRWFLFGYTSFVLSSWIGSLYFILFVANIGGLWKACAEYLDIQLLDKTSYFLLLMACPAFFLFRTTTIVEYTKCVEFIVSP